MEVLGVGGCGRGSGVRLGGGGRWWGEENCLGVAAISFHLFSLL